MRKNIIYDDDDDNDDEDTLDIRQGSSVVVPSVKNQGEKNVTEKLLADDQMELVQSTNASTPKLPQSIDITPEVHTHSLNIGDEHLSTVPKKESDEFIKSSAKNLVPIPGE